MTNEGFYVFHFYFQIQNKQNTAPPRVWSRCRGGAAPSPPPGQGAGPSPNTAWTSWPWCTVHVHSWGRQQQASSFLQTVCISGSMTTSTSTHLERSKKDRSKTTAYRKQEEMWSWSFPSQKKCKVSPQLTYFDEELRIVHQARLPHSPSTFTARFRGLLIVPQCSLSTIPRLLPECRSAKNQNVEAYRQRTAS